MPQYIAFLRAINVGGHIVKMDALRKLFEGLKYKNVETFIASGNVIFEASSTNAQALEEQIQHHLQKSLGYEVGAFLRTPARLAEIAAYEPFAKAELAAPGNSLYIHFLQAKPSPRLQGALDALQTPVDEFHVHDREIYWLCRKLMTESLVNPTVLGKTIGQPTTSRNAKTIRRLAAKYPAPRT